MSDAATAAPKPTRGRLLVGRDAAQIDRLFVVSGVDRQLGLVDRPSAVVPPAAMEHAR